MRRFLTLVCLLGLAIPTGISFSGCTRNPAGNYCNGLGYGLKDNQVANITLQPLIAGISLAYGQTVQVQSPAATTCKGASASVGSTSFSYATTNNQLVDISPTGNICAGTWNRNSGGGIADYTYCNYPNPLPSTGGLPYSLAYITATALSVTSNPVTVYVHAPVSSISLVTTPISGASTQGCFSQNQQADLDAQGCFVSGPNQYELCAPASVTSANFACKSGLPPGVTSVPDCGSSIGTLTFTVGTTSIATISPATTTNTQPTITALQPGTTVITATIAESSSSAGYFSTCPPSSIAVNLNTSKSGVVTQGVVQNLSATVYDTQGAQISGLALNYQSTDPIDITASSGAISPTFPGVATIYATCQPPTCNPAPINQIGLSGTGLSLASNPVTIIVPGTSSDFVWFSAPGQSQYVYALELLTGVPGNLVRLPYVPNSMVMDQTGTNIYFGSPHELMVVSTSGNTITKQDTTAPGVVLAVSPNGSQALINDQVRGLFYLYNTSASSSGTASTFPGLGAAAAWTPDSNTLYIADSAALNNLPQNQSSGVSHTDTLYVYNAFTGWSSYMLACSTSNTSPAVCNSSLGTAPSNGAASLAIAIPGVGAWLAGNPAVAHTWCPSGIVGNNSGLLLYPQSDSIDRPEDLVAATLDGGHILGASLSGSSIALDDIGVTIPAAQCPENRAVTPQTMGPPLSTSPVLNGAVPFNDVSNVAAVNQIVAGTAPSTASVTTAAPIAFVTYTAQTGSNAAARLPYYLPQPNGTAVAQPGYVSLTDSTDTNLGLTPTAPLAGAFSPDHSLFFVSTAGDNLVHVIGIPANLGPAAPPAEIPQNVIAPGLPACTPPPPVGNGIDAGCLYPAAPTSTTPVPATAIVVKPRSVT